MTKAYIAGFSRTPFTPANKGELIKMRPDDLGAIVAKSLVDDLDIDPETIEDLIVGCAFPEGEQGLNLARNIVFLANLPNNIAATTVNRFCGSSMQAIHMAVGAIHSGSGDAFLCLGVESMTRIPMPGFNPMLNPKLISEEHPAYIGMGETAENLAKKYNITFDEQNIFSEKSHRKAFKAREEKKLKDEIIEVRTHNATISLDSCIRPDTTNKTLSELKPAFDKKGTVTAGTSSPLTDGAAGVLIVSENYSKDNGIEPIAEIKSMAVSGCSPEIMGIGPVEATNKALKRAGLKLSDIDVIELNEAFAAQSIAVLKELNIEESKLNIDGGAIAIGHPLGATGARITGKAAQLVKREQKNLSLATQCIGGGQGIATIMEAI